MPNLSNLATAVLAVMKQVKNIEKDMTVGTGTMSYKGVADINVKRIIGEAMAENGLCILPIGVEPVTKVDRWEETTSYNGQQTTKQKQSVFTEVKTKYLLLHTSGESVELEGYGQGVDSQDKSAGKATTYALKYALLYTFLIPTGKIDDADNTHSDSIPTKTQVKPLPELLPNTPQWNEAVKYLQGEGTIDKIKTKYLLTPKNEQSLKNQVLEVTA